MNSFCFSDFRNRNYSIYFFYSLLAWDFGICNLVCKAYLHRELPIQELSGYLPFQHIMWQITVVFNNLVKMVLKLLKIGNFFMVERMVLDLFIGGFDHGI